MRVLLVGGAGYVGSVAARLLLSAGHEVRVLDSLLHGGRALLGLLGEPGFEFVRGDVRDEAAVREALDGREAVVNLAAIVGDPACARQPDEARAVNTDASLALYRAAAEAGAGRFLFASTCSNYGKMSDPDGFVAEDSELRPVSLYAETKVEVERFLLEGEGRGGGPDATVLRFATVFGLSPRMRFDLTVNEFAMELEVGGELEVFGEQFWRPYVHVRDAARSIVAVLDAPADRVASEVFNVGDGGQNFTKKHLVEMILPRLERPVDVRYVRRTEDPRDYRVAFDKIRDRLGYGITTTVEEGIEEVLTAIRQGVLSDFDDPTYRN